MPKRILEESEEDRLKRKLKKYQKKLSRVIQPSDRCDQSLSDIPDNTLNVLELQEHSEVMDGEISYSEILPSVQDYGNGEYDTNNTDSYAVEGESLFSSATSNNTQAPADKEQCPEAQPIDPLLLQALGDCHSDTPEWGDNILEDIACRWEPILKTGLKKEIKDELNKKYLFPKNVSSSKAPELNPEISAALAEACRNRDTRICNKQGQLGRAIAALGRAMSGIITKNMETNEIIKTLNDAGRLIGDSHFLETETRRSLVTPLVDKSLIAPLKDRKRDRFLFGENLGDFVKSSRGIKKTGQLITPPSFLNYKAPPQRLQRNPRTQQSRGGGSGQRPTNYGPRRNAQPPQTPPPPHPPPPAPRRAPPAQHWGGRRALPSNKTARPRHST